MARQPGRHSWSLGLARVRGSWVEIENSLAGRMAGGRVARDSHRPLDLGVTADGPWRK